MILWDCMKRTALRPDTEIEPRLAWTIPQWRVLIYLTFSQNMIPKFDFPFFTSCTGLEMGVIALRKIAT